MEVQEEIWKDIPGYEGFYQASSKGRIRTVPHFRAGIQGDYEQNSLIRKPYKNKNTGYLLINLSKNGKIKTFLCHRIVALTFIENPNGLKCVNHIDGNRENNNVYNLEWCTYKYNIYHARKILKKPYADKEFFVEYNGKQISVSDLAKLLKIDKYILYNRLKAGWDIERAISQPVRRRKL